MRILYKDKRCPVCTIKLEYVYMCDVSDHKLVFKQLDKEKDTMVKDDEFKENGIYYTSYLIKEESLKLRNFICPISNCSDGSFETLQNLNISEARSSSCEFPSPEELLSRTVTAENPTRIDPGIHILRFWFECAC
jgi:hypothetical protein